MRIALVNSTPRAKLYPLPLLKIGAYLKAMGQEVEIYDDRLPDKDYCNEIWITTLFTFDIPHALALVREARKRANNVKVGGVSASLLPEYFKREGAEVHVGLMPDVEQFAPDYSLLNFPPKYSLSHTSRGCSRKCGFCMVHKLEPEYSNRLDWVRDISPQTKTVLFYDNNWLAKDIEVLRTDIDKLKTLVRERKINAIDFNQGLDARLMTEEIADMLTGLPIKPIRFAFDGMHEDGYFQRAVKMMASKGFHEFMTYVLYNYKDTPEDFYYRLRVGVELNCPSFPMRYQPILDVDKSRDYVGEKWSVPMKKGFMALLSLQSIGGAISYTDMNEFEYWFGKTPKEFVRLLSYPKLRELLRKKKGALRLSRLKRRVKNV